MFIRNIVDGLSITVIDFSLVSDNLIGYIGVVE